MVYIIYKPCDVLPQLMGLRFAGLYFFTAVSLPPYHITENMVYSKQILKALGLYIKVPKAKLLACIKGRNIYATTTRQEDR
jgi:hypothetical protein